MLKRQSTRFLKPDRVSSGFSVSASQRLSAPSPKPPGKLRLIRMRTTDATDAMPAGAGTATATEHVDVLIVGAGLSGIGAACHLQRNCPGKTLRDPGGARARSAAPGTCSATRACARTPTCTRSATRSARGRTPRRSPTARRSSSYVQRDRAALRRRWTRSASATRVVRAEWSTDDARWTVDGRAHRHRRDQCASPAASCSAAAATTATTRATRRTSRASSASRPGGPSPALARGPGLRRQARRGDRQRRHRGDAGPGDGRDAPRT